MYTKPYISTAVLQEILMEKTLFSKATPVANDVDDLLTLLFNII